MNNLMYKFREKNKIGFNEHFERFCCRLFNITFDIEYINRSKNKKGGEGYPVEKSGELWNYEAKSSLDNKESMNSKKPSNLFKKN